jgi:hypothetical protein
MRKHFARRRDFGRRTDDLLTLANLGGIGMDFVGLGCLLPCCWYEYCDDGAEGGIFRLQFAPAALSVCSHIGDGYL